MSSSTAPAVTARRARDLRLGTRPAVAISTGTYVAGALLGAGGAYLAAVGGVTPDEASASAADILMHNLGILVWLSAGVLCLGLSTIAVLLLNGIVLGWVAQSVLAYGQPGDLVTGILPHLPLELGAYLVAASATLQAALPAAAGVLRRRRTATEAAGVDWRRWLGAQVVAVLLLAVGAVVEATISHV